MSDREVDEAFERHWASMTEGKLELIHGKLVICTLAGSRWIAREIARDYGPFMWLPMAPADLWWQALQAAYWPHPLPTTVAAWETWSDTIADPPDPAPCGPRNTREHHRLFEILHTALWQVAESGGLGQAYGRDFVIRLGENGLTPDTVFMDRTCLSRMRDRYLEGPPTVAIEIVSPFSAAQDRVLKRRLYEEAGIPEYWQIEPEALRVTFFQRGTDGRYQPLVIGSEENTRIIATGEDRVYRSVAAPDLALSLLDLWTMKKHEYEEYWRPLLRVKRDPDASAKIGEGKGGVQWDEIPFAPRVGLEPCPIRFAEYAAWCGRAKFERYGGGMKIDGTEGCRRVSGLLLMTFGMIEILRLTSPREWVICMAPERYAATVAEQVTQLMARAEFKERDLGREPYTAGTIDLLPDLWAYGRTRAECEQDLAEGLRKLLLLRIARHEPLPPVG